MYVLVYAKLNKENESMNLVSKGTVDGSLELYRVYIYIYIYIYIITCAYWQKVKHKVTVWLSLWGRDQTFGSQL